MEKLLGQRFDLFHPGQNQTDWNTPDSESSLLLGLLEDAQFFSAVSNFVHEGTPANITKSALINLPVGKFISMNHLLQSFPETDGFITFDLKSNASRQTKIQNWFDLIRNIRNKVRETNIRSGRSSVGGQRKCCSGRRWTSAILEQLNCTKQI
jgi:hypothetical protein